MEDTITTAEASRIINRHPSVISRLVTAGKLVPARQMPGLRGAFLFDRADIEALVKGQDDDS